MGRRRRGPDRRNGRQAGEAGPRVARSQVRAKPAPLRLPVEMAHASGDPAIPKTTAAELCAPFGMRSDFSDEGRHLDAEGRGQLTGGLDRRASPYTAAAL